MNPGFLKILLHLGSVIREVRAAEKLVTDVVHGAYQPDDLKAVLEAIPGLLALIPIPDMEASEVAAAIAEVEKSLGLAPAVVDSEKVV